MPESSLVPSGHKRLGLSAWKHFGATLLVTTATHPCPSSAIFVFAQCDGIVLIQCAGLHSM